jgi:YD repeat-containing protein
MSHRVQLRARAGQHFVYWGRSSLVTDLEGLVRGRGIEGYYAENTRLLSRLSLCAAGRVPRAVAVSPVGGNRLLSYYEVDPGEGVPEASVYITLDVEVTSLLAIRLRIDNYSLDGLPCSFDLAVELEADFADSQEAEKQDREQDGEVETEWIGSRHELWFRYRHPKLDRAARIRVIDHARPVTFDGRAISMDVHLASRESTALRLEVRPVFDGKAVLPEQADVAAAQGRLREEVPRLSTSNEVVARAWRTATSDLASLALGHPAGPAAPIAGIPLYQQFFGRDTLTTAWQALLAMPSMMRDVLTANAALAGRSIDDWFDEEPGKMIHQATHGPLATLGLNNNLRNYGDYATAPDFLIMLGQYLAWTGDVSTASELLPVARRVVEWIERYGDLDGDGLIEYRTRSAKGVRNQGWKDADDAIVDASGKVVEPPIATVELQGYVYAGLQQAALAFGLCGDRGYAIELVRKARSLRRRINERFWMPEQRFYAMALGPDKEQVDSISSNPAHLLACGVVPASRARAVARRLMAPDMFSGWGIRSLTSENPAYNPFSYHRGSVWPVENGTAALGFARYGLWTELHKLAEGIFSMSELFEEGRLPETAGGLPRDTAHPHPGIYPASCAPQAWSASMVVVLLQSLAGMLPFAPLRILVVDPHLPPWLPDLRLEGIAVGDARVDLAMRRHADGTTRYRWHGHGNIRVVRQPPPEAPAGIGERVWTALRSLI